MKEKRASESFQASHILIVLPIQALVWVWEEATKTNCNPYKLKKNLAVFMKLREFGISLSTPIQVQHFQKKKGSSRNKSNKSKSGKFCCLMSHNCRMSYRQPVSNIVTLCLTTFFYGLVVI